MRSTVLSAALVSMMVVSMLLTGCGLCPPPKPEVAPYQETEEVLAPPVAPPVAPPPVVAAPVVPIEPVRPVEPVEPVKPVEVAPIVPPAVVKAIQDLGEKYPGLFTFDPATGMFRFNSDITFDSGSAVVKPQAKAALTKLAEILVGDEVQSRSMRIVGHTDSDRVAKATTIAHLRDLGKAASNQGLSEARAEAVAAVLKAGGVVASRMSTSGRGAGEPVADNSTASGKARNRRVEIYLSAMGK